MKIAILFIILVSSIFGSGLDWVKEYPKQCQDAYNTSVFTGNDEKLLACYASIKEDAYVVWVKR